MERRASKSICSALARSESTGSMAPTRGAIASSSALTSGSTSMRTTAVRRVCASR